jgi:hypothetical protein
MQRVRRVALVAALAVLGVASLAGCRSQPTVAAYVGTMKITEAQVNRIVDSVKSQLPAGQLGTYRQRVVSWLVVGELARRLDRERGYPLEPLDRQQYVDLAGQADPKVPALDDGRNLSRMAQVHGDWYAAVSALLGKAQPAQPTEEDKHAIFDYALARGELPAGTRYEDVIGSLNVAQVAPFIGLRNELRDAATAAHLSVNPRYGPLVLSLNGVPLPLDPSRDAR